MHDMLCNQLMVQRSCHTYHPLAVGRAQRRQPAASACHVFHPPTFDTIAQRSLRTRGLTRNTAKHDQACSTTENPSSDSVTSIASPHPVLSASEKPQWYKQYIRLCQNRKRTAKYVWGAVLHHLDLGGTRPDRSTLGSERTQRLDSTKPSTTYREYPRQDALKQEKERNNDRCIRQELCNKNWVMVLSRLETACVLEDLHVCALRMLRQSYVCHRDTRHELLDCQVTDYRSSP